MSICNLITMFQLANGHDDITLAVLAKRYSNEDRARKMLERLRWPDGPVCPHCGNRDKAIYPLVAKKGSRVPCRKGLYCCGACREQFTVKVGTVMESSHIPISKWLMAFFIIGSSKKAISAHQMHRMLGVTYKTAWFLCHRIRHAMSQGGEPDLMKGVVETDEAYFGPNPTLGPDGKKLKGNGYRSNSNKVPVVALVQRNGDVRTQVVPTVTAKNLRKFMDANNPPERDQSTPTRRFGYKNVGAAYYVPKA